MSDDAPEAPDAETSGEGAGDATDGEAGDAAGTDGEDAAVGADDGPEGDGEAASHSDLVARVAQYDEALAAEVREVEARTADLEAALEDRTEAVSDLESRLKRVQADFQNYKKRAERKQEQIRERATEDLVTRLTTVRNNLVRALEQDESADIRDGVEATLTEFDRVLEDEGVSVIDPAPGEAVDPTRHEVMMRVESDQPAGTVVDVYQPGYSMADKVLKAAQVTVSTEDADGS